MTATTRISDVYRSMREDPGGNGSVTLTEISFVLPITAGKEEEWRRTLQELEGSRVEHSERTRRRLGIGAVRVWLQRTRWGAVAVVHAEVDDPTGMIAALAGSDGAFEGWLKRKVEEFHGVDVSRAMPKVAPELVFRSASASSDRHEDDRTRG